MIAVSRPSVDIDQRVDFPSARKAMLALASPLPFENVSLAAGTGRVVARAYRAQADLIPYARSAMDGFAVRAVDTLEARSRGVVLPVIASSYAGETPGSLRPHCAIAIATGAPLPAGADAVVPIECVERHGAAIVVSAPLTCGQHVFQPGDDAKFGDVLLEPGDVVTPGRAALLAAAGYGEISVYRRPRVTIVCTGDEVVAVGERPAVGQVRNSNASMLAAHLARDGADLVGCVQVGDSLETLRTALRRAIAASDLVITTGGASVGERDLVKRTLAELGTEFAFRSVALRPAKPTAFGRCGATLVAVLAGNPAAAFVGYATLVRGVVRALGGQTDAYPAPVRAALEGAIRAKAERHFVIFGKLAYAAQAFSVSPLDNQCSSLVRTSADANALIVVPPGLQQLSAGAPVSVEVLDWNAVRF